MLRICTYFLIITTSLTIPYIVYCKGDITHYDNHIGVIASTGSVDHFTTTNRILSTPSCCTEDLRGSGSYYSYGFALNYVISNLFDIQVSAQLKHFGVDLKASEKTLINFDGTPENAVINHVADISLVLISSKIALNMLLVNDFYASMGIGSLFDIKSRIEQYELLVEPFDRGTFPDTGTRRRNHYSGDLDNFSGFVPYFEIGIGKQLPLDNDKQVYLDLSANIGYSFLELIEDSNWRIMNLNLKVVIYFRL